MRLLFLWILFLINPVLWFFYYFFVDDHDDSDKEDKSSLIKFY